MFTILPGAELELDAVRINWRSFATRVVVGKGGKGKACEVGREGEKIIKHLLPRASLTSLQLGLSGAGLLALW